MYTLFGNDLAVQYARSSARHDYPAGSVLSLVTWNQQEDPRWFGGKIPAAPKSVEFVAVATTPDNKPVFSYQFYEGNTAQESVPAGRNCSGSTGCLHGRSARGGYAVEAQRRM